MNVRKVISTGVITLALVGAGAVVASAQVVGTSSGAPVTVTTTPVTTAPGPGTNGATLATVQISGTGGANYSITSIPFTMTPGNGSSASDLSDCQLTNINGSVLNSGNNVPSSIVSGSNTFTLDTPLTIDGGAAAATYILRCNVAPGAISGGTYQFIAGNPVYSTTSTTGTGALAVSLNVLPTVPAGTQNAVLGILGLDASNSGSNVTVSSVPVTLTFNGNSPSDFSDCSVRSAGNLGVALNTGVNAVAAINTAGATTFTLDTPMNIPAGSSMLLALTCDVSSATPAGSTVTASVDPAMVMSTVAGSTLTPTTAVSSTGVVSPTSGTVSISAPSTSTGTTGTGTTVTPGAPNTGEGGMATSNLILLALAGAAVVGGGLVISRTRSALK